MPHEGQVADTDIAVPNETEASADGEIPKPAETAEVSETGERLLLDIAAHPLSGVAERYSRLGLSAGQGSRIQKKLLEKGLIKAQTVSTGKAGVKMLELTEKGMDLIGAVAATTGRHGGLSHRYWIERVARKLEQEGYSVQKEWPVGGGKTVDIVAEKSGGKIAVEVETGGSDILGNIKKCQNAGFKKILCVVPDIRMKEALDSEIRKNSLGEVQVVTLKEALEEK